MENWEIEWKNFLTNRGYGELIDEYLNSLPSLGVWGQQSIREMVENRYKNLKDYFGEVPEDIQRRFIENSKYDFVLENLQSHDYKKLMEILNKIFDNNFGTWEVISKGESNREFINWYPKGTKDYPLTQLISDLKDSKELKKWTNFFGYTFTIKPEGIVQFEPEYPETGKNFIQRKCHGICYHVSPIELADSILKSGLRCSNEKRTGEDRKYRNFPKRVYLYATEPKKGYLIQKDLEKIGKTVYERPWKNLAAFKIYLPDYINVYKDSAMKEGNSFFTYTNIPAEYIERIH